MSAAKDAVSKIESPQLHWVIAAGVVGADIGTSVFYGTGILFPIVGYWAPVFVLTACLMMWLFKQTYEEGLALSPYNGGAYSMILRSIGRRLAVLAGALTFVSYLATASVSALSGGYYLSTLMSSELSTLQVVWLAFIPLVGFGLLNSRGIKEPAKIVTLVAGCHFALLMIIVLWGLAYLAFNSAQIDWSKMSTLPGENKELSFAMLAYGFAAAFLGITGFESAAQIVEELQQPALQTVRRLYKAVIILVSLTAPAISFLCLAILTQGEVQQGLDTLLSSLAYKLGGGGLRTIIVVDASLTLFAAVNTAFVGFIGLATTMAKQGNLPQVLLKRFAHIYPSIQGYPLIALPFAVVSMMMVGLVSGEVHVVAKVYEISFLGVMVSFCIGTVLMRNRGVRQTTPMQYLSKILLHIENYRIAVVPLFSGLVLAFACLTLLGHSSEQVGLMLLILLSSVVFLMVYHRWGVLENRLETHSDLRLGLGRFTNEATLPENLPPYILCIGGRGERHIITTTIVEILQERKDPFELVVFHAEDAHDVEGFFFERLQRVVSQQIAPLFRTHDFVLTVKIVPGNLIEGLHILKKSYNFQTVLFGSEEADDEAINSLAQDVHNELDVDVLRLQGNVQGALTTKLA